MALKKRSKCIMAGFILGLILIGCGFVEINGDEKPEPYYGVRIGSFGDSDVYAADSKTVTIVGGKIEGEPGCK